MSNFSTFAFARTNCDCPRHNTTHTRSTQAHMYANSSQWCMRELVEKLQPSFSATAAQKTTTLVNRQKELASSAATACLQRRLSILTIWSPTTAEIKKLQDRWKRMLLLRSKPRRKRRKRTPRLRSKRSPLPTKKDCGKVLAMGAGRGCFRCDLSYGPSRPDFTITKKSHATSA